MTNQDWAQKLADEVKESGKTIRGGMEPDQYMEQFPSFDAMFNAGMRSRQIAKIVDEAAKILGTYEGF